MTIVLCLFGAAPLQGQLGSPAGPVPVARIYVPAENLGIRIEDDVLVTPRGYEVLSSGAPRTVAEVERVMGHEARGNGGRCKDFLDTQGGKE